MFQGGLVRRWSHGFDMKEHEKEQKKQHHESDVANDQAEAESETVEIRRVELEELKRKVEEFSQLQERLLRSAADFENAKKRLSKERGEFVKYALEDLVFNLLPVLDNFNFALSHMSGDDEKTKSMREGFLLIQKQILQTLSERGLKPILTLIGKLFDPYLHEAVCSIFDEDKPEGSIVEEVQTGYELNGKLIRPAKVKISTQHRPEEEKTEELT